MDLLWPSDSVQLDALKRSARWSSRHTGLRLQTMQRLPPMRSPTGNKYIRVNIFVVRDCALGLNNLYIKCRATSVCWIIHEHVTCEVNADQVDSDDWFIAHVLYYSWVVMCSWILMRCDNILLLISDSNAMMSSILLLFISLHILCECSLLLAFSCYHYDYAILVGASMRYYNTLSIRLLTPRSSLK